jgi:hypothetical protein|tara:strand:+ start:1195 stop:1350 length:156 start_codon:yes stop_codon:yes gene_type:complete
VQEIPKIEFLESNGALNILVPEDYLGDKNNTKEQLEHFQQLFGQQVEGFLK